MQRRHLLQAVGGSALAAWGTARAADDYPSRPVRVVLPFAAGGGPDVQMRQMAPPLGEALGQPVVVENKVGAGGVLGYQHVAQSAPDGYTLMFGASTLLVQKSMQPALKLDPLAQLAGIGLIASSPTVLVVRADGPHRSLDELLRAARANPGKMNYGSGGIGTSAHLAGATIVALSGITATHIPLKGSVEMPLSLLRGDTDFGCPIAGTAVAQVKAGKLRALAVTGRTRLKELPDVPTLHELMRNELVVQETWFAFWAPKDTPAPVVARLHAATARALANRKLQADFEGGGSIVSTSESPAAFNAFVQAESSKWDAVVRLTGVKAG